MQIERRSTPEARAAALAAKKAAEAEAEARRIAAAQVRSHRSPISGCTALCPSATGLDHQFHL